jgi:hypothetical protein
MKPGRGLVLRPDSRRGQPLRERGEIIDAHPLYRKMKLKKLNRRRIITVAAGEIEANGHDALVLDDAVNAANYRHLAAAGEIENAAFKFEPEFKRCWHVGSVGPFTPNSGHVQCTSSCLLWAKSGHQAALNRSVRQRG